METLIYEEKGERIFLSKHLSKAKPFVLGVEPFVGEASLFLILDGDFQFMCTTESDRLIVHSIKDIPASFFILAQGHGSYICFFCLSHNDMQVELQGMDGGLEVKIKSGDTKFANQVRHALLCVEGDDLYQTVKLTMHYALKLTGGKGRLLEEKQPHPEWMHTLGWQSSPGDTHQKIVNTIWGLRQKGVQVGYVLVDQGWEESVMTGFEAETIDFPYGLKGLVEDLQRAGISHIGVRHAIMGGEMGIHKDLALKYDLPPDGSGRYFLGHDLGRTFQFFYDYYQYLHEQGISFVQVFGQNSVGTFCKGNVDPTLLYRNLQSAIQAASSIQFDCPHLNSDCLVKDNLFYWSTSRVASTGGDSILFKLRTSLWLHFFMEPFFGSCSMTDGEELAVYHALSGSINCMQDNIEEYHADFIKKMVLPCGRVLKADEPLRICPQSVFDEKGISFAQTSKGEGQVVVAFNRHDETKTDRVVLEKMSGHYAIFSYRKGLMGAFVEGKNLPVTLEPGEFDIFTFVPIYDGIAVIGCDSFYLTTGPIQEITLEEESLHIRLEVAAPMILYSERQILEIRRNGSTIPWEYDAEKKVLVIDPQSEVLNMNSVYTVSFA